MKKYLIIILIANLFLASYAQTPAFPGAEGFGRYTTGGRGGTVYYVNTLEDNQNLGSVATREGSLRWCLKQTGKRTILFKVSGTIRLKDALMISSGNVTIAGQSAPGDGICLADHPVTVNSDNVIIRYLRFRMGDLHLTNADGSDGLGGRKVKNVIIDHCSISWGTDECASFYENENFTLQWCMATESLRYSAHSKGAHGYGAIWGGGGYKSSFHHNLLAHHQSRVPRLGAGFDLIDIRNNVYYNYDGEGCYGGDAMSVNIVNNYYKPGPAFTKKYDRRGRILSTGRITDKSSPYYDIWGKYYIDGNYVDGHKESTADNWTYGVYNQFHSSQGEVSRVTKDTMRVSTPHETDIVTTHTAEDAFEKVLAYAGASLRRDDLDARIVEETRTNTALFVGLSPDNTSKLPGIIDSQNDIKPEGAGDNWSAWPTLNQEEILADTNRDGIPDAWLEKNYPDKKATDVNEEGYTYLEVYLNELVKEITDNQNKDSTSGIDKNFLTSGLSTDVYFDKHRNKISVISNTVINKISAYNLYGMCINTIRCENEQAEIDLNNNSSMMFIINIEHINGLVTNKKIIK